MTETWQDRLMNIVVAYFMARNLACPNLQDSASFMLLEAGEVLDQVLRDKLYTRNHPNNSSLEEELGDVMMMTLMTAFVAGINLEEAMVEKMISKAPEGFRRDIEEWTKENM